MWLCLVGVLVIVLVWPDPTSALHLSRLSRILHKEEPTSTSNSNSNSDNDLPIFEILDQVTSSLFSNNTNDQRRPNLLLEASPGAGKTTIVPLALFHQALQSLAINDDDDHQQQQQQQQQQHQQPLQLSNHPAVGEIWLVQPRRVAVRSAAARLAALLGEPVGQTVGYIIRDETKVSPETKIKVVSDGILLQRLRRDESLEGISTVILDEFHERGINVDLCLALARASQEYFRNKNNPLSLVIMSATLLGDVDHQDQDSVIRNNSPAQKLLQALGGPNICKILQSEGRQYPIQTVFAKDIPWKPNTRPLPLRAMMKDRKQLVQVVCEAVYHGLRVAPGQGDLLVFLPGAAEIKRTVQDLQSSGQLPSNVEVLPLYGALPKGEQDYALQKRDHETTRRRVIVSSPIAEASLTIDGITCVVDSGLRKSPRCDVDTHMPRLLTTTCSRAAAIQRAGRAGRLQPGLCLRIYSESDLEESMPEQEPPEILSTDLSQCVMWLVDWGCTTVSEMLDEVDFVDKPNQEALETTIQLLVELGALSYDDDDVYRLSITSKGQEMVRLPTHPRLATAMVEARAKSRAHMAATALVGFLLDEETTSVGRRSLQQQQQDANIWTQVRELISSRDSPNQKLLLRYASRLGKDFKGALHSLLDGDMELEELQGNVMGEALLAGFKDLVAEKKGDASYGGSQYLLALGRTVRLENVRDEADYLLVLDTSTGDDGKTRIRQYLPISYESILEVAEEQEVVFTVPSKGYEVRAKEVIALGSLELQSRPLQSPSPEKVSKVLKETIDNLGGFYAVLCQNLPKDQRGAVDSLCQRVQLASSRESSSEASSSASASLWPKCFEALDSSKAGTASQKDQEILQELLEPWLATVTSLKQLEVLVMLQNALSPAQQYQLDTDFPLKIPAPDGSQIPVSYASNPPSATAKLQQFFGSQESPTVGPLGQQTAVSLSLLSPGGKIVAQTMDLPFFWKEAYPSARAELRGRYPKHPWPEDPLTAVATRQTKKQLEVASTSSKSKDNEGTSKSPTKKKRPKRKR